MQLSFRDSRLALQSELAPDFVWYYGNLLDNGAPSWRPPGGGVLASSVGSTRTSLVIHHSALHILRELTSRA